MFVNEFKSIYDIANEYNADIVPLLQNSVIHLAWYGYGSWSGCSWVIYEHEGKLYEVNAAHCSCYGLEGQWKPEETSWKAIAIRKFDDFEYDGGTTVNEYVQQLCKQHII